MEWPLSLRIFWTEPIPFLLNVIKISQPTMKLMAPKIMLIAVTFWHFSDTPKEFCSFWGSFLFISAVISFYQQWQYNLRFSTAWPKTTGSCDTISHMSYSSMLKQATHVRYFIQFWSSQLQDRVIYSLNVDHLVIYTEIICEHF